MMFKTFESAQKFIKEKKIRMIDLKWGDYAGRWHHVTISAHYFTPHLMRDGVGFDSSAVGFKPVTAGDMVLIPDLATGFIDPFFEDTTLSFIAGIHEAESKEQFVLDPREVLRQAEKFIRTSGVADGCLWGPEFEFFIFGEAEFSNGLNHASYRFDSPEANWSTCDQPQGYVVPPHGGYHRIPPGDRHSDLRNRICVALEDIGIPVKYHHHEAGGPGHNEIEPTLMPTSQAGDASMLIRYFVKMAAFQDGLTATFLPKPLYGEAGNGMHFHQQLVKGTKNVFYDSKGYSKLSQTALYYIGGLLTHAQALTALTNPSTNSYRRLTPGFEAPVNCFFGTGDRSAAIRIPKYATDPSEVRMEYRPPDGTCNPYLAMAAMLMAGMDGIVKKIDPTRAGFGPFEGDISALPPEKRPVIKGLPTTLNEAALALKADHDFLLAGQVFNQEFIEYWIAARVKEYQVVNSRPHPYEIELYYDL
jgi:glutamine synthetase